MAAPKSRPSTMNFVSIELSLKTQLFNFAGTYKYSEACKKTRGIGFFY